MKTKSKPKTKLKAAARSWTVRLGAFVTIALAGVDTLKEQMPALAGYLPGWQMAAAMIVVSTVATALRVWSVVAAFDVKNQADREAGDA